MDNDKSSSKLKILYVSSEAHPFARTGGLADVAGSLPKSLRDYGHDVVLALPLYQQILNRFTLEKLADLEVQMGEELWYGALHRTHIPGNLPVFLVEQNHFYNRKYLYGDPHGDYPDNAERFAFFCRAILQALKKIDFKPDIIHCNDWQTALIPLFVKTLFAGNEFFKDTATVFTIHNLAYQGHFHPGKLKKIGIREELFTPDKIEFFGSVNPMKAGLLYADVLNTVSPTYSREIQTRDFGFGLEGVLQQRKDDLFGILNGIDYEVWNPSIDKGLMKKFDPEHVEGKRQDKIAVQKKFNLPETDDALIGMVTRLDQQKGFDLVIEIFDELMKLPVQLIILGWGNIYYHNKLKELGTRYPQKVHVFIGFHISLAQLIYAGSDIFLMPSTYEPCGIAQMKSMHYGTIPVVRKTGGLADTVKEFDPETGKGNGFLFEEYSSAAMLAALKRALSVYKDKVQWYKLVYNAMKENFSWEESTKKYDESYRRALSKKRSV